MVVVSGPDGGGPPARIAWRKDAWFGVPAFGEVAGRAVEWKQPLDPVEVADVVLTSRLPAPGP